MWRCQAVDDRSTSPSTTSSRMARTKPIHTTSTGFLLWVACSIVAHVGLIGAHPGEQVSRGTRASQPMTFELLEVSGDLQEFAHGPDAHSLPNVEPPKPPPSHDRPRVLPAPRTTPAAAAPSISAPFNATPAHAVAGSQPTSTEQPQAEPKVETSVLAAHAVPPQAPPVASRRPSGSSPGKDAYYRSLRAAVERHRSYPRSARRAKLQGTVVVRITVSRAGQLLAASVSRSSGEEVLDVAALSAVRLAAQLPEAPAALESNPVTVDMPFVFRLQ